VHFAEPDQGRPFMGTGELETYGIEDCRVAKIDGPTVSPIRRFPAMGVGVGPEDHPGLEGICP